MTTIAGTSGYRVRSESREMIFIRVLSLIGLVSMAGVIATALITGDFFTEGSEIWSLPWGRVSLVDIYVGLAFFAAWIGYREHSMWARLGWWIGLVLLGNFTAALYLTVAAYRSSNPNQLLTGDRAIRVADVGG